jgi:uncharacterized repeat protein (TIGR01451 family)
MKKRPLTYTVLAAAAMISLGVGASLAQGGNGGGGANDVVATTLAPPPPPVAPAPVPAPPAPVPAPPAPVPAPPAPVPAAPTPPPPAPPALPTADLQLSGRASTGSPAPGSSYTFTFTVKNSGTDTADNVVFTDQLPSNASYNYVTLNGQNVSGCTANGIGPDTGGTIVECTVATLAKGGSANIVIAVTAPEVAATVTNSASVASDAITDPNPANNSSTVNVAIKLPAGSVCKGGTCDLVPTVQAAPCAALTSVTAPVGYYLIYAAIWNTFTVQSCSSSAEAVSVQIQELNTITGAIDYDVTWFVTLTPSQNFSMVLDNDFAAYSTPYTITYTVRDSSGNVLSTRSTSATTPGPK